MSDTNNVNLDISLLEKKKKNEQPLLKCFNEETAKYEIGIDEAGRGPLFGRVYSAAVILPKDNSFRHDLMKDSKKFTNWEKLKLTEQYIKEKAISYAISYEDEKTIDKINILQATFSAMHNSVNKIIQNINHCDCLILVDGNMFKNYIYPKDEEFINIPHICVKGGDNIYSSIAAASILAKVARDEYIHELCKENPLLDTYYGIGGNKGYAAKKHRDGIDNHGISKWHRKTFGICKKYNEKIW